MKAKFSLLTGTITIAVLLILVLLGWEEKSPIAPEEAVPSEPTGNPYKLTCGEYPDWCLAHY